MLPNLVVIGAEKAGTTSMYFYLSQHPDIYMAEGKELNFFIADRTWSRGVTWYTAQFETSRPYKVYGEASPLYTAYPEGTGVAERMHQIIPEARLIFMVRDPVERMVSDYFHHFYQHMEHRSWDDIIQNPAESPYLAGSMYYARLKPFLENYPPDHLLILPLKDLKERRLETMQRVFRFVGVDDTFNTGAFLEVKNDASDRHQRSPLTHRLISFLYYRARLRYFPTPLKTALKRVFDQPFTTPLKKPAVDDAARQTLIDLLRDDIQAFRQATGLALDDWCV